MDQARTRPVATKMAQQSGMVMLVLSLLVMTVSLTALWVNKPAWSKPAPSNQHDAVILPTEEGGREIRFAVPEGAVIGGASIARERGTAPRLWVDTVGVDGQKFRRWFAWQDLGVDRMNTTTSRKGSELVVLTPPKLRPGIYRLDTGWYRLQKDSTGRVVNGVAVPINLTFEVP